MNDTQYDVTITALREQTISEISALLNPKKHIKTTDTNLPRDWNGLAELCGIRGELIPSIIDDRDPTKKVLELWRKNNSESYTIRKLLNFFEQLDRFDIIDDVTPLIEENIRYYLANRDFDVDDTREPTVNRNLDMDRSKKPTVNRNLDSDRTKKPTINRPSNEDEKILTIHDAEGISSEPFQYDAFVLYAEQDMEFAMKLIETMENEYNLTFFDKERDLLFGVQLIDATIKIINRRCKKLIVILSDAFAESNENKFFLEYATKLAIENTKRRVIPCKLTTNCQVPDILGTFYILDCERYENLKLPFWEKLRYSIQDPMLNQNNTTTVGHSKLKDTVKYNSMINLSNNKQLDEEKRMSPGPSAISLNGKRKKSPILKNIFGFKQKII